MKKIIARIRAVCEVEIEVPDFNSEDFEELQNACWDAEQAVGQLEKYRDGDFTLIGINDAEGNPICEM